MKKILLYILLLIPFIGVGQVQFENGIIVNNNAASISSTGYLDAMQGHANYVDTTDQTIASVDKGYAVTFNIADDEHGVTLSDDSVITVTYAGTYLVTFSGIWITAAPNKYVYVWMKKNNVNVPYSATQWQMLGTNQERVVCVTYILELAAGDNISLHWQSNDVGTILNYTTGTGTIRPTCPSMILTINKASK
jgi:hypothetical protein